MPLTKEKILEAIKKLREINKKRNFTQSLDVQISLRNIDVKKPENRIKEYVVLPHAPTKKRKIAIFVDKELAGPAKEIYDLVIKKDDFKSFTNKREIKKMIRKYKYFVAQANLMGEIANTFGKYLGPIGKMPDPKAGCIIPIKVDILKPVYEKLQKTVKVFIKDQPTINVMAGDEKMSDEQLADNILTIYKTVQQKLPRGEEQIKSVHIKFTMSEGVVV